MVILLLKGLKLRLMAILCLIFEKTKDSAVLLSKIY